MSWPTTTRWPWRVSVPEVVEAAIARTEQVAGPVGALALECFDQARAQARAPRGGYFSGVPTLLKDNVDVAGLPTQQGSDAFAPRQCGYPTTSTWPLHRHGGPPPRGCAAGLPIRR